MVLSKREQFILIAVGVIVGGLLINGVLIEPLLAKQASISEQIEKERHEHERDMLTVKARARNQESWRRALAVLKRDESEAGSQILNQVRNWAEAAGLDKPSVKVGTTPQPVVRVGGSPTDRQRSFLKLTCRASGSGGMSQVSRFLWQIQTSAIPVRITDLSITSSKENTDQLDIVIGLSTIFLSPEGVKNLEVAPAGQTAQDRSTSRATNPTSQTGGNRS